MLPLVIQMLCQDKIKSTQLSGFYSFSEQNVPIYLVPKSNNSLTNISVIYLFSPSLVS
jgi:hypothetical protein